MAARQYVRGHPVICLRPDKNNVYSNWVWEDTLEPYNSEEERPCIRCSRMPTKEGYDACLGHIDGAKYACCGHGVKEPYIVWEEQPCLE